MNRKPVSAWVGGPVLMVVLYVPIFILVLVFEIGKDSGSSWDPGLMAAVLELFLLMGIACILFPIAFLLWCCGYFKLPAIAQAIEANNQQMAKLQEWNVRCRAEELKEAEARAHARGRRVGRGGRN